MPIEFRDTLATLSGVVTVDEVDQFAGWLRTTPKARVSLRRCRHLHTGVFQAMLRYRPKVTAAPTDPFLAVRVLPLLNGGISGPPPARHRNATS
ncbi:hypothetical protein HH310_23635 [Actinoplanes sp. TBRC 11911]|uniref:hypothetical protein n=1 Tax=Actinoplanes sp. TBRC 11911 TaxID=2729386 RepID=UPI00145D847E|nr:hypothetical protein [Actinoplanes sp. TBRC 11911]NMO54162.1 hypothetical protein [Actinoplanes sp. TBRC 11911]